MLQLTQGLGFRKKGCNFYSSPLSLSLSLSLSFLSLSITFGQVRVEEGEYQVVDMKVLDGVQVVTSAGRRGKEPSVVFALTKTVGGIMFVAGVYKLGNDILAFASPQLLK